MFWCLRCRSSRAGRSREVIYDAALSLPSTAIASAKFSDRPGDWGDLFDRISGGQAAGDLVILDNIGEEEEAYAA